MKQRTVKQRGKSDCAIAAIANASGQHYSAVKKVCGPIRDGLSLADVTWLAGKFGGIDFRRYPKPKTRAQWDRERRPGRYVLLMLSDPCLGDLHAVASVDGEIIGHGEWPIVARILFQSPEAQP